MANLVSRMPHAGKRGDTIHIPRVLSETGATAKANGSQVDISQINSDEITVVINKWFQKSVMIEDFENLVALPSLRMEITRELGYALARRVDFELHVLGSGLQGGTLDASPGNPEDATHTIAYTAAFIGSDGATVWDPTANTNTGNGTHLSDVGLRRMIQRLDDVDAPEDGRVLVIPPVERNTLMGLARYSEQAFVGDGNVIKTGMIGELYGIPVYVSSACPKIQATDASTNYRAGMLMHKDAFIYAEQQGVRSQAQYKQEYLGTLFTVDTIFGVAEKRDDHGMVFIVPA